MNLKDKVFRLKAKPSSNKTVKNLVLLMKELHWSYNELLEVPLPAVSIIMKELDAIAKEQKKEMDKKRK
jgi:hypothetical protein